MSDSVHALGLENCPEQRSPVDLEVAGTIPPWLQGVLFRTGPGTFRIPLAADNHAKHVDIEHWFDGIGMNHRFEILPGSRVTYSSRKSGEQVEARIAKEGRYTGVTFGQDPCKTIFRKFFTALLPIAGTRDGASDANVSVTLSPDMPGWNQVAGARLPSRAESKAPHYLVGKTDANNLQLLDPDSLEPLALAGYAAIDPRLDGQLSAAHSCVDQDTGDFFNFVCKLGPTAYKVFKIPQDGHAQILATITDAPPAYLHSLGMTAKYVIFTVWQAYYSYGGISIPFNGNLLQSVKPWNPGQPTVIYVIDRQKGGIVAKYKTPAFFCFHHINAYDDGDDVVLDLSVYDDHSVLQALYLNKLRKMGPGNPLSRRYRLRNVDAGTDVGKPAVREADIGFTVDKQYSIELPTISSALYHKPYRYAYGINKVDPKQPSFVDRIVKLDMHNPSAEPQSWGEDGFTPGEPIFVPTPGGTAEDDGVVMTVVLDGCNKKSMLAILDASSMREVARAEIDHPFPLGFHGAWVANE